MPPEHRNPAGQPTALGRSALLPRIADPQEHAAVTERERPVLRLITRCRRCRHWLLAPQSVAHGIGPTCAAHAHPRSPDPGQPTLFDIAA
ncbi:MULTISPECIES: DUF6011 domain-containing protein [Nocardia]|uniref:DUF6011 domain-containing protein n=1 Tax=Nocardia TaxID=1817 RepID=UPI001E659A09|nr:MULTISPECIES: DUF6011 domain-containing protein [Nocardia]